MTLLIAMAGAGYLALMAFTIILMVIYGRQFVDTPQNRQRLLKLRVRTGYRLARWCSKFTPGSHRIALANIAEGTYAGGKVSYFTDAALATRYLLVKKGSDNRHVAVAGAADTPFGLCTDEASAAEELVNVQHLAIAGSTLMAVSDGGGVLDHDDFLIPATGGKVKKAATAAGMQYIVGRVCCSTQVPATDGAIVQFTPIGSFQTIPA